MTRQSAATYMNPVRRTVETSTPKAEPATKYKEGEQVVWLTEHGLLFGVIEQVLPDDKLYYVRFSLLGRLLFFESELGSI